MLLVVFGVQGALAAVGVVFVVRHLRRSPWVVHVYDPSLPALPPPPVRWTAEVVDVQPAAVEAPKETR